MKRKIIIDTDPGHDDAMALMLAIMSEQFDVMAITTVCGNSTITNTTKNARYVLKLIQREDIPVYSGAKKPLTRKLVKAVVHGSSGLEGIDPDIPAELTNDAAQRIKEIVEKYPDEITLVTLGPLTNIAQAIIESPGIMKKVAAIVSMAGAIAVPGNKNRVAEFNVFVDPEATDIVFKFPVDTTTVPLDACNNIRLGLNDFRKIKNYSIRTEVMKMVIPYIANIGKDEGVYAALMYDPLTVFYMLSPESCKIKKYNVAIETAGEVTRGMTVADLRLNKDRSGNDINVVTEIDKDSFKDYFIKTLSR